MREKKPTLRFVKNKNGDYTKAILNGSLYEIETFKDVLLFAEMLYNRGWKWNGSKSNPVLYDNSIAHKIHNPDEVVMFGGPLDGHQCCLWYSESFIHESNGKQYEYFRTDRKQEEKVVYEYRPK